jgi:integrase
VYAPFIGQYLDLKRSLGYVMSDESQFREFDKFAVANSFVTPGLTRAECELWGERRMSESSIGRYKRFVSIRSFLRYLNIIGIESFVPRLPSEYKSTFTPHIYSGAELERFFKACDSIAIDPHTYTAPMFPALFRLLYGTGIRIGEALALRRKDVNLDEKTILLRETKNGQDRILPISDSLCQVLYDYISAYSVKFDPDDYFFLKKDGDPVKRNSMSYTFRKLLQEAQIPYGGRARGPRIHDFRHTFSVHSLAEMSEAGLDLYYALPLLSKYLGHTSLEATDKYVRLTEEMFPSLLEKSNKICAYVFPEVTQI